MTRKRKEPEETKRTIREFDLSNHIGFTLMWGIAAGTNIQKIYEKIKYLQSEIQLNPFNPHSLENAEGEVRRAYSEFKGLCEKIDSQIDSCVKRVPPKWERSVTSWPIGYDEAKKEFNDTYQIVNKQLRSWGGQNDI